MTGSGGKVGSGGATGTGGMTGSGGAGGMKGTPDAGAAGAGGVIVVIDGGPVGCRSNSDCADTSYCRKATCTAERGVCTAKPTDCMDDPAETEVCGCNGVTYFSSCLAELNGENVGLHGICADGVSVKCSISNPACVNFPNGYCGFLVPTPASCPNGGQTLFQGQCFVLPDSCPTYANRFSSCNASTKCVGTCEAVKNEKPFYRQLGCN
jgi:hypothetical protein